MAEQLPPRDPHPHDAKIIAAHVWIEPVPFRMPLKFGGRVVDQTQLINAAVTVEGRDGQTATGHGSMPVGNVWGWPSASLPGEQTEAAMVAFAHRVAASLLSDEAAHPVELMHDAISGYDGLADDVVRSAGLPEPMPKLAQLVAASPLDAAVHDAYGRLHHRSSFAVLGPDFLPRDLSHFLDDRFAGQHLDAVVSETPTASLPLYHLVGGLDPLTAADLASDFRRPDDLPVTLDEWIAADGLTHLKIKLTGADPEADLARVLAVDEVAESQRPGDAWNYSADFNENCPSAAVLTDWLDRLERTSPRAFGRIQYLEQPTRRDLDDPSQSPMHDAARRKPVVIDESLTSYAALLKSRDLGYSGVALKACKGQTEALLAAAAARHFGLFLCVQDLTCPGASLLHSVSLAAHLPDVTAIEGNGRQYCPAPNAAYAPHYPGLFDITNGTVDATALSGDGLGFEFLGR